MNTEDSSAAAPPDFAGRNGNDNELVMRLLGGLSPAEREHADAGGQFLLGMFDVLGVAVAALVGRGLIDPHNLRCDLLGLAKMWREQGSPVRAIPIEREAENLVAVIAAIEAGSRKPPN